MAMRLIEHVFCIAGFIGALIFTSHPLGYLMTIPLVPLNLESSDLLSTSLIHIGVEEVFVSLAVTILGIHILFFILRRIYPLILLVIELASLIYPLHVAVYPVSVPLLYLYFVLGSLLIYTLWWTLLIEIFIKKETNEGTFNKLGIRESYVSHA